MNYDEVYLGDGLFASFDGIHVMLFAQRLEGNHYVFLEPNVLAKFQDFLTTFVYKGKDE